MLAGLFPASRCALIEETVWLGDIPVATLRPSGATVAVYYVHSDQLNTPRQVTRPSDNTAMWTRNSDPFGTDAANPNPSGAGIFVYSLRLPGQVFDGQAGLHDNGFRAYDPAKGGYIQSDPIGLNGGINTYSYSHANPLSNFDPLGLDCTSSSGITSCSYPGGPSFRIPTPIGFPARISGSSPLYHRYDVSVSTQCADSNLLQALINSPAPGDNIFPASPDGTKNVAHAVFTDNPILSYVTTDLNTGNTIVVNTTNSTGGFSPGYVARTVSNGVVNNYGEGLALAQSPLLLSAEVNFLLDQYVWRSQTNNVAKQCGCNR